MTESALPCISILEEAKAKKVFEYLNMCASQIRQCEPTCGYDAKEWSRVRQHHERYQNDFG